MSGYKKWSLALKEMDKQNISYELGYDSKILYHSEEDRIKGEMIFNDQEKDEAKAERCVHEWEESPSNGWEATGGITCTKCGKHFGNYLSHLNQLEKELQASYDAVVVNIESNLALRKSLHDVTVLCQKYAAELNKP